MTSHQSVSPDDSGQAAGAVDEQTRLADEIKDTTVSQLLSKDQEAILDCVDQLRAIGLQLPLPQIIVCGNQSSGKSSLLEAISRLSFPKGIGVCTTFPTELALRRGPTRDPTVDVKFLTSRTNEEKESIKNSLLSTASSNSFESVVREAKKQLLAKDAATDSICEDILHIEVHNPSWPPLTLVDLPGIIHFEGTRQTRGDVAKVRNLVRAYMRNPNTVILAVIPATEELESQLVLQLAKEVDPDGKRTMGIMTRPDEMREDQETVQRFVRYVKNEEHKFELGWHVVKNPGPSKRGCSMAERDNDEKQFFANVAWRDEVEPEQLGIACLRSRLSSVLMKITRPALPALQSRIQLKWKDCQTQLGKLGPLRSSRQEQLAFVTQKSIEFHGILDQSLRGDYDDLTFFKPGLPVTDPRRLRAAIQNLNEEFAEVMYKYGRKYIFPPPSDEPYLEQFNSVVGPDSNQDFSRYTVPAYRNLSTPGNAWLSGYPEHVAKLAARNKGPELPGIPNSQLIGELFREQSESWEKIALSHVQYTCAVVQTSLKLIANHTAPPETADAICNHIMEEEMLKRKDLVERKLQELLKPYRRSHPITYDPIFFPKIRSVREQGATVPNQTELDGYLNTNDRTGSVALGYMLAYYDVAIATFIDNVATLAIEQCLLDGMKDLFNPSQVPHMDDTELERLTSESQATQMKRKDLKEEEQKLKEALRIVSRSFNPVEDPHTSPEQTSEPETRSKGKTPIRSDNRSTTFSVPLNSTKMGDTSSLFSKTTAQSSPPASGGGLFGSINRFSGNSDNSASSGFGTGLFGSSSKTSSSSPKFSDHAGSGLSGSGLPKPPPTASPFRFSFDQPTTSSESSSNVFGQSASSTLFGQRSKSTEPTNQSTSTLFPQPKGDTPSRSSSTGPDPGKDERRRRQKGEELHLFQEKDTLLPRVWNVYQSIGVGGALSDASFEEIKYQYYIDHELLSQDGIFIG